MLLTKNMRNTF